MSMLLLSEFCGFLCNGEAVCDSLAKSRHV